MRNLLFLLLILLSQFSFGNEQKKAFQIELPEFYLEGISAEIKIIPKDSLASPQLFFNGQEIQTEYIDGSYTASLKTNSNGQLKVIVNNEESVYKIKVIPLWLSIVPPLLTILLALLFKEVISSLFIGLFFGSMILYSSSNGFVEGFFISFMRTMDHFIVNALSDSGHISVIVFSLLIGGMVSVINSSGGMQGIVKAISRFAKDAKSGQFTTWLLGVAIFFDDYANTLVVGKTMRPVTDQLKISREKLAYLVDSTAAPIASIALITTWIGAELGYIADGISSIPELNSGVYGIFLNSLQYSYYPILSLVFILILIRQGKDYGPMLEAERLARFGRMSKAKAKDKELYDLPEEETLINHNANAWLAIVPILTLLLVTIFGLIQTGMNEEVWSSEASFFNKLSDTIGNSDSYKALLWGSSAGLIMAIIMSYLVNRQSLNDLIEQSMEGIRGMIPAIAILTLAWSLALIIDELHTADFLSNLFNESVNPYFIPIITFLLSAIIAFSTGSSWGTMAILYPLILPLSWQICAKSGWDIDATLSIFYNVVSSVLAGSVLGDHCSPISDTTILSSLASDCDHIQHVKTQMPYALTVGAVASLLGTIPAAYGSPFWINLPLAIIALWMIVHFFGGSSEEHQT